VDSSKAGFGGILGKGNGSWVRVLAAVSPIRMILMQRLLLFLKDCNLLGI